MSDRHAHPSLLLAIVLAIAAALRPPPRPRRNSSPASNYICPNNSDTGLDCYLDAVRHLYTMCRHVKSIEVIEFGYEKSQEGVNGAKSDYCIDKQKINITRPYQAALAETKSSKEAVNGLRTLQELWLEALAGLTWKAGETDEDYKVRVARPYVAFGEWTESIKNIDRDHAQGQAGRFGFGQAQVQGQGGRQLNAPLHAPLHASEPAASADEQAPDTTASALADDAALAAIFGEGGTLARELPGFHFRPQQLAMAQAVARTIAERGQLVAEAGTGTGKTFAYLVPALLYGGKVIVSTGTKTLQDQLYERDLPLVRDALRVPVTIALLKGRANYVCHYHLERASHEDRLPSRDDARHLKKIIAFSRATQRGDRAELADVPENATIWPLVTSTRDNCLGQNCAYHGDCFVLKARRDALDADVVVVNHHLFFADVMLRDEGVSELLPNCNTVILDEAHQLPDTATLFFGEQVGAGQLAELARDAEVVSRTAARDVPDLPDAAAELVPAIQRLRLAAGNMPGKFPRDAALSRAGFAEALDGLAAALDRLATELGHFAERGEELALVARRADDAARQVARWRDGHTAIPEDPDDTQDWIRWIDVTPLRLPAAGVAALRRAAVPPPGRRPRRARGSSRRPRSPSAATSRSTRSSSASTTRPAARGTVRSTIRRRDCSTCRTACRRPTRSSTPTPSSTPRCRCCARAAAARSCCSRRCARCSARASVWPLRSSAKASTIRCWCRAKARSPSCWCAFASWAMPCCWAARASGKAWTCRATRCRWSSSTSCRSRRRTIRCSRRASTASRPTAAIRSWTGSCRRRPSR